MAAGEPRKKESGLHEGAGDHSSYGDEILAGDIPEALRS